LWKTIRTSSKVRSFQMIQGIQSPYLSETLDSS
jgi:hypothetical protein